MRVDGARIALDRLPLRYDHQHFITFIKHKAAGLSVHQRLGAGYVAAHTHTGHTLEEGVLHDVNHAILGP